MCMQIFIFYGIEFLFFNFAMTLEYLYFYIYFFIVKLKWQITYINSFINASMLQTYSIRRIRSKITEQIIGKNALELRKSTF